MKKLLASLALVSALSTSFINRENFETETVENKAVSVVKSISEIKENAVSSTEFFSTIDFSGINQLNPEVFEKAYKGFQKLKAAGKLPQESQILSIVDFSLSSNTKRLWIIDLNSKKVLFNSLVAHGKNTGDEFATNFSNNRNSLQSSLGFYVTDDTYFGGNGYSLRLHGMDKGWNDAALERAVVMHGAKYVSEQFAAQHKRIGRSWGCPAVPSELAQQIIDTVKGKQCLFLYYPDQNYLSSSEWLL